VSDSARILYSVIGQRCVIGEGSVIRGSYLFDDVVVEAGSVVERSVLGERARVKEGSTVQRGCLLGDGVVLGPAARLAPFERVSKRREKPGHADDDDEEATSELDEVDQSTFFWL
jgi:translation initiation factor eIF-2B subunit epsilon